MLIKNINHDTVVTWVLSALAYDEKNMMANIERFFPTFKCHFVKTKNGALFFGIVMDEKNGKFYLIKRGTDGDNFFGKFKGWVNNFRAGTSGDGTHNGFEDEGNLGVDRLKKYFYNFDYAFSGGHSKGSGITQYDCCLLAENFPNLKSIQGDAFATPPTFDHLGKLRVDKHVASGRLNLVRWNIPGDPITSKFLRGGITGGVDVGVSEILQDIIKHNLFLGNAINHSVMVYHAGMIIKLLKIAPHLSEEQRALWDIEGDQELLGSVSDFIVN